MGTTPGGQPVEQQPFMCGIMTPWQRAKFAQLGHGATLELDCTFGTNKYMVSASGVKSKTCAALTAHDSKPMAAVARAPWVLICCTQRPLANSASHGLQSRGIQVVCRPLNALGSCTPLPPKKRGELWKQLPTIAS